MSFTAAFWSAVDRLKQYNLGIFSPSNLFGLSGVGGMDANWARHSADMATVGQQLAKALGTNAAAVTALVFTWDAGTASADPGSGKMRATTGTLTAGSYNLVCSTTDADGNGIASTIADIGASTSTTKARARLVKTSDWSVYIDVTVTALTTATGYRVIAVTYTGGPGGFAAGDAVALGWVAKGDKGDTGAGGITGGNATGAINETAVTLASASTTDIGSAAGNYVTVSGTTTITALGTAQAGTERVVRFSGALTLTHNATSLILPSGANIITAAGDAATFRSEGSGNWRCVSYMRASGQALVSGVDTETIQDTVAATLVAGSGTTIVYDDAANTITISSVPQVTARYWAIRSAGSSLYGTPEAYATELELFTTANATGADQTTGKTAAASSQGTGFEASKAIDDNTSTSWNTAGGDSVKRLYVDLGSSLAIRSLRMLPYVVSGHPIISATVYVEYSNDTSSWSTLATLTIADTSGTQTFTNLQ